MDDAPVLAYAWPQSVAHGEAFGVHLSSPAGRVDVEIARVGATRTVVHSAPGLPVGDHPLPADVVAGGCDWPVALEVTVDGWPSGFYEITATTAGAEPDRAATSAFVVVRPSPRRPTSPILLALATNTWHAYNDTGGGSLYTGAPVVSRRRPMARGFLDRRPGPGDRLAAVGGPDPAMQAYVEHVAAQRLSLVCGSAGWWNWERPFVAWAERHGYALDVVDSTDLERHPDLVADHRLVCSVGHDEYWTWGMRDTVEAFASRGGNVAFLSGNTCYWQVRFEPDDATMVCHKQRIDDDPVLGTDRGHLLTSIWSDHLIGRPENTMTGVSFVRGGYARIGRRSPAGPGGYVVHRPEHWLLGGTGLAYGDLLGAGATVVGYECDGCDLRLVDGRPQATTADFTPPTFEVVATAPAQGFDRAAALLPLPDGDVSEIEYNALRLFGSLTDASVAAVSHGHAVLGLYTTRGGGTVVTTGCTDWAYGLREGDPAVEQVTRTVLDRLGGHERPGP